MSRQRGFAVIDAVMVVAVVALLACVLVVGGGGRRGVASQSESLGNLKQFAAITSSYAADYQDRFWAFSWTRQVIGPTQYPDILAGISDGFSAQAAQFTDIIRRRGNQPSYQRPSNFYPSGLYSHLVLADYLNSSLFMPFAVAPGHQNLRRWHENPTAFLAGQLPPQPNNTTTMFATSYELPPAFFSTDRVTTTTGAIVQGANYNQWQMVGSADAITGVRRVSDVTHPSNKVHLNEAAQFQGSRLPLYWAFPDARVPVLMVDGSSAVRTTDSANSGWRPDNPTSPFWTTVGYTPNAWDPQGGSLPAGGLRGRYRFTRGGLGGRDFDGQEVTP